MGFPMDSELFAIDDEERLFISPVITDWSEVHARGIEVIIDLEGDLDQGISTRPGHILYIYHHIYDEDLPNLIRMQALALAAAHLVRHGQKVLVHCSMGFNRSALLAGMVLTELGCPGCDAVTRLRARRPGALFNECFAEFLASVPARTQSS